ncbi:hypothetical protein [Micromonospora wenchangensis]|uniref:hypothetical protein n=1 Tax=Micromonospora wenchangensis TaxID=1185415 RepID=UPI003D74903C
MADTDAEDWTNSVDKPATFPPPNTSVEDVNDLETWARMDPPGWRRIKAVIKGGSAIESDAGREYAASLVNPQSLIDAANAFQEAYNLLHWLETFVSVHSHAIAGEEKPWQGTAARAFLAKMDYLGDFLGSQAERLLGGAGMPETSGVPYQLMLNASYLKWAQEQVDHLDVAWAQIAAADGANHTDGGNVAISSTRFARPMTDQMLQVAQTLAKQYARLRYGSVSGPDGDGSLVPEPPTPPAEPTPPPDPPTPPPYEPPPPIEVTPPPPPSVPPPTDLPPPPDAAPPPVAGPPPPALSEVPAVPPPPDGPGVEPPGAGPAGPPLAPPGTSGPPGGLPGLESRVDNPPGVSGPPGLGNGPGGGGGSGGVIPPVVPGPPGGGNQGGGPNRPVVPPAVNAPPNGPGRTPGGPNRPVVPPALDAPPNGPGRPPGDPNRPVVPPAVSVPPNVPVGPPGGPSRPVVPPAVGAPPNGPGGVDLPGAPGAGGGVPGGVRPPGVNPPGGIDVPPAAPAPPGPPALSPPPAAPMPGTPGSPGGGPGGGSPAERPDAAGLVEGDQDDWAPTVPPPGDPSAPGGADPGGVREPGISPPPGAAGPAGVPMAPPGSPGAPGSGGGGAPDRPDAGGLVDGDPTDWRSPTDEVDLPSAPAGAAAGGTGLAGGPGPAGPPVPVVLPVPPASTPPRTPTTPSRSGPPPGGRDREPEPGPGTADPAATTAQEWRTQDAPAVDEADVPVVGAGPVTTVPAVPVPPAGHPDDEPAPVDRPDAARLLHEEEPTWTGVEPPADEHRVVIVRPAAANAGKSAWDDYGDAWWLPDDAEREERTTDG